MRKVAVLILVGVLLVGSALAMSAQEDSERFLRLYPASSIKEMIKTARFDDNPCKNDVCFNAQTPGFSVFGIYTGKARPLPPQQKAVIKLLAHIGVGGPRFGQWVALCDSEVEVVEGGVSYWLPILNGVKVAWPPKTGMKRQRGPGEMTHDS